jgi:hypothetical protein
MNVTFYRQFYISTSVRLVFEEDNVSLVYRHMFQFEKLAERLEDDDPQVSRKRRREMVSFEI